MYIKSLAEIFGGHGRAFDMPAGKTFTPRARPAQNMFGLSFFPKSEIGRMPFFGAHSLAAPFFLFLKATAA